MTNIENIGSEQAITIKHASGLKAKVLTYGATLAELWVPDAKGEFADITLGHDIENWRECDFYAGATCGRYANRIANGRFMLDGRLIEVTPNEGVNQLHGGPDNFSHQTWTIEASGEDFVRLSLISPDGANGFPAEVHANVTYRFAQDGKFWIEMRGHADATTILNMANHSYFNLAGYGSGMILDQHLQIAGNHYTPVREDLIPTGEIKSVEDTPFDFRQMRAIGQSLPSNRGFDHNFCLSAPLDLDWGVALRPCAKARDLASGRSMEIRTNQPGLQFYSGGYLHGKVAGKGGSVIAPFSGFALETQVFPDSPNNPQFPSARLEAGQEYCHITAFDFTPQA